VSNPTYRVKTGTIWLPDTRQLPEGCVVPEGAIDETELAGLIKAGIVEEVALDNPSGTAAPRGPAPGKPIRSAPPLDNTEVEIPEPSPVPVKGKWNVDPALLEGKDLQDLLIMVMEIDPKWDLSTLDEEAARFLLSKDFVPVFQEPVPEATAEPIDEAAREAAKNHGG